MRSFITLLLTCTLNSAQAEAPKSGDFGLGLTIGSLLAINGKYWVDNRGALSFGFGGMGPHWTVLYGEYLLHIPGLFGKSTKFGRETYAYAGGGAGLGFWRNTADCGRWGCDRGTAKGDSGAGGFIRGLFGFEWYPKTTRFGVFAELGPNIILAPGTGATLDADIGGRYYF